MENFPAFQTVLFDFFAIVCFVSFSGILALTETAVLSSRRALLQKWADHGDLNAAAALSLMEMNAEFRATVQFGTIFSAIASGVTVSLNLGSLVYAWLSQLTRHHGVSAFIAYSTSVLIVTLVFVVFGKLIPKNVGTASPERSARAFSILVLYLVKGTFPIVRAMSSITDKLTESMGFSSDKSARISDDEIEALVEEGKQEGIFKESEQQMLSGVLNLDEVKISSMMTNRAALVWLDVNEAPDEIMHKVQEQRHTRYVVADGDLDHVLGVVNARDLFLEYIAKNTVDLKTALFKPMVIPENKMALKVLDDFKESRVHCAFVMDEYGDLRGLVTMSDILEGIVGDLLEFGEVHSWNSTKDETGGWLFDATIPIGDLKRTLEIASLPGEEDDAYQTLGGFVLYQLEHIPVVTEKLECNGWEFEVLDMDRHRITKIRAEAVNVQLKIQEVQHAQQLKE